MRANASEVQHASPDATVVGWGRLAGLSGNTIKRQALLRMHVHECYNTLVCRSNPLCSWMSTPALQLLLEQARSMMSTHRLRLQA